MDVFNVVADFIFVTIEFVGVDIIILIPIKFK